MANMVISDLINFLETKIEIDNDFCKILEEFENMKEETEHELTMDKQVSVIDDLIDFIEDKIDEDDHDMYLASYVCICEDFKAIMKKHI